MRPARRPVAGVRGRRDKRSVILTAMLLGLLAYFLLPLVWLVINATKSTTGLFDSFGLWFASDFHLFENIRDTLTYDGGIYGRWFLNTVLYAVAGAGGAALLAALGGYGVGKFGFPGGGPPAPGVLGGGIGSGPALGIPPS